MREDWIETSLDVFRSMTEVLLALRERLRSDLLTGFGEEWLERGVPEAVLGALAGKKEREDTVAWYSTGEREIFDYADFFDIMEILVQQPAGIELLCGVFPQQQILRARLMELQVVAQKLSHGHQIAEEEVSLLANLRIRLKLPEHQASRRQAAAAPSGEAGAPAPGPEPVAAPEAPAPAPPVAPAPAPPVAPAPASPVAPPAAPPQPVAPPPVEPPPPSPPPTAPSGGAPTGTAAEPARAPQPAREAPASPAPAPVAPVPIPVPRSLPRADAARSVPPAPSYEEVLQALDRRQSSIVLRALYSEIMTAAENVWERGSAPSLRVWHTVRESSWYQEQFVNLGLRPISDFYSIIEDLQADLGATPSKDSVHRFLAGRAFAQVLMSLRELFQRALKS